MSDPITCPVCHSDDTARQYGKRWACLVCAAHWREDVCQPDPRLAALEADRDRLAELLTAYREKRASDGLNGRPWHAGKHLDAEDRIVALEGADNV